MFGKIIYTKEDEAYFIKRVIPEEWLVIEEDINHIECEGEGWSR